MYYLLMALYALHVISAIVWFGGGLTNLLITGPALARVSERARGEIGFHMGAIAARVYPIAATVTIVLGVVLTVLSGRVANVGALLSPYGVTVAIALTLAVGVWLWGKFVIGPAMHRMQTAPPEERPELLAKALKRVAFEQFAFVAVFGCMVLMRFGV